MTNETHKASWNVSFSSWEHALVLYLLLFYKATLSFPCPCDSRLSKWTLKCFRLKKELAALEWISNLWGVWFSDHQRLITTTILRWDVCATTVRNIGKRWEAHPATSAQGMLSTVQVLSNLTSLRLCKCQWEWWSTIGCSVWSMLSDYNPVPIDFLFQCCPPIGS